MINKPSLLLSAVSGYGYYYLQTVWDHLEGKVDIAGIIDPTPEKSGHYKEIVNRQIPVFADIEQFYASGKTADLAVISSPIHYHVPQSLTVMQNGGNVLCEKPLAAAPEDVDELIRIRDETGKWALAGYQWSYSRAVQKLKRDILDGRFGKPLRMKSLCFWRRGDDYYKRNDWAGKIRLNDGTWVLDSPANNAMAHFLHNMFYLAGGEIDQSAFPEHVKAGCWRVNPIENYDTIKAEIRTENDVRIFFVASHATETEHNPVFQIDFEQGTIQYGIDSNSIAAVDSCGNRNDYGSPDDDHQFLKLFRAVEKLNKPVPIVCGPEAAKAQTVCVHKIQESLESIGEFPRERVIRDAKKKRWFVKGLDSELLSLYNCWR